MNDDKFDYSYSAPSESERREIESIRKQYTVPPKAEDKLEKLRKLNRRVTRPPLIVAVVVGIVGTLVFGVGMTMVLEWSMTLWGVLVGVLGLAVAAVSYPLYRAILGRNKRKYGGQIVALSNELLNTQEE